MGCHCYPRPRRRRGGGRGQLRTTLFLTFCFIISVSVSSKLIPDGDYFRDLWDRFRRRGSGSTSGDDSSASTLTSTKDTLKDDKPTTSTIVKDDQCDNGKCDNDDDETITTTTTSTAPTFNELENDVIDETNPNSQYLNGEVPDGSDVFDNLEFVIHRNGDGEGCGRTPSRGHWNAFHSTAKNVDFFLNPTEGTPKYAFDSFFTNALVSKLLPPSSCPPSTYNADDDVSTKGIPSLRLFCDMGPDRTPILPDHNDVIPLLRMDRPHNLPCHFHTREGVRITSLHQLAAVARSLPSPPSCEGDDDDTCPSSPTTPPPRSLHLYAVPTGRVFLFAPTHVGEIFHLPHVRSDDPHAPLVSLRTLSLSPRVFDVLHFFNQEESAAIVDKATKETSESHRMKRSSTGASGYNVNAKRTSDNGFDTHGKTAMDLKRRCFKVLGFESYHESFADGLQVLRYNKTNAYIPHLDWIDDPSGREPHDYESGRQGTNRFATILLYMSDLPEGGGGETVFSRAWRPDQPEGERVPLNQAIENVRSSPATSSLFKQNSWQEKMIAECQTRLSIKPHASRAVLFYSQHPDGTPDDASFHGACPILTDTQKWAANLWVWNGPRGGYPGAPLNKKVTKDDKPPPPNPNQIVATFTNTGQDSRYESAELYFQETFWASLRPGDTNNVNTFKGHEWNVKVNGKTMLTWIIGDGKRQTYSL